MEIQSEIDKMDAKIQTKINSMDNDSRREAQVNLISNAEFTQPNSRPQRIDGLKIHFEDEAEAEKFAQVIGKNERKCPEFPILHSIKDPSKQSSISAASKEKISSPKRIHPRPPENKEGQNLRKKKRVKKEVIVSPRGYTLLQWIKRLKNEKGFQGLLVNKTIKNGEKGYILPEIHPKVQKVFRDTLQGLIEYHKEDIHSGRLKKNNVWLDTTGIYVLDDNETVVLICEKMTKKREVVWPDPNITYKQDVSSRMGEDLNGFLEVFKTVLHLFNPNGPLPSPPPAEYLAFLKLYNAFPIEPNSTRQDLESFTTYIWKSPIFLTEKERVDLVEMMDLLDENLGFHDVHLSGLREWYTYIDPPPNFKGWQTNLKTVLKKYENAEEFKADLHGYPVFEVLAYKWFVNWSSLYQYNHGVVRFYRNCIHHMRRQSGKRYDRIQAELRVRAQIPHVLPELYVAMVKEFDSVKMPCGSSLSKYIQKTLVMK